MPEVLVLIGLPGSGKSTWREKFLAGKAPDSVVCVSQDDIIEDWAAANGMTYSQAWSKVNQKDVAAKFRNDYKAALNAGKDIIIDRTNMGAKARKELLKHVPESYHKVAVVFVIPDPELKARLKAREAQTGKAIPEFVINNMAKAYVAPTREEFDEIRRINS